MTTRNDDLCIVVRKATFRELIFGRLWRLWHGMRLRRARNMRLDEYELRRLRPANTNALYHG